MQILSSHPAITPLGPSNVFNILIYLNSVIKPETSQGVWLLIMSANSSAAPLLLAYSSPTGFLLNLHVHQVLSRFWPLHTLCSLLGEFLPLAPFHLSTLNWPGHLNRFLPSSWLLPQPSVFLFIICTVWIFPEGSNHTQSVPATLNIFLKMPSCGKGTN